MQETDKWLKCIEKVGHEYIKAFQPCLKQVLID